MLNNIANWLFERIALLTLGHKEWYKGGSDK